MSSCRDSVPEAKSRTDEIKSLLASFIAMHPSVKIESIDAGTEKESIRIVNPWNDETLAINISIGDLEVIDALNTLLLPEPFSAVYHVAAKELEVIYTSYKVTEDGEVLKSRTFDFEYQGETHVCRFSRSSDKLLAIARKTVPRSVSPLTNFRNLQSFILYTSVPEKIRANFNVDEPISFWISNFDYNNVDLVSFVGTLNFYVNYYDSLSPLVLLHDIAKKTDKYKPLDRFVSGSFPRRIQARDLDQNLVSFWNAVVNADTMLSFILMYRILEYNLAHFMDDMVRRELKRLLSAPDIGANLARDMDRFAAVVHKKQLEEVPKFKAMLRLTIDPKNIWAEISKNRSAFTVNTHFDGDFVSRPIISSNNDESSFCLKGMESFSDAIRRIRNALSHGKDIESSGVILPTYKNLSLLRPWVNLMTVAAREVILYRDLN